MRILVVNGPNLSRLGKREPEVYGSQTLTDLEKKLNDFFKTSSVELIFFQSNIEGEIINCIEDSVDKGIQHMVINPGAFTHTSVALRDCIAGTAMKTIEVHISNVYKREEFRHKSLTAPVCEAVISGMGFEGYKYAIQHLQYLS
jgi:3-dehydroquinate dehydratase-2